MEKYCLFVGGQKINPTMAIEAKVLMVTNAVQSLVAREISSASIARRLIIL